MKGILADNDIQGHLAVLVAILQSPSWRDFWLGLQLPVRTFEDLGLSRDTTDAVLWHTCQRLEVVLITGNRNQESVDSLEATLRAYNTPNSLPVFALANPERVYNSKAYAEKVAERLLEYLLEIDKVRGTGRLYLP